MLHVWPHLKDNDCPPTIWMIYQQNQFYKIQWLKKDLLVPNANHDFTREKHMWIISALLVKWSALANSFTLECFTKFSLRIYLINFTWVLAQWALEILFARALLEIQFRMNFILGFTLDLVQVGCYLRLSWALLGTRFKKNFTWDSVIQMNLALK